MHVGEFSFAPKIVESDAGEQNDPFMTTKEETSLMGGLSKNCSGKWIAVSALHGFYSEIFPVPSQFLVTLSIGIDDSSHASLGYHLFFRQPSTARGSKLREDGPGQREECSRAQPSSRNMELDGQSTLQRITMMNNHVSLFLFA